MSFASGRVKLVGLDYRGKPYNLCYQYDGDLKMLSLVFIDGDYTISTPAILWNSGWVPVPGPQDAQTTVDSMIANLNIFLLRQFGTPIEPTWAEAVLALVLKMVFFLDPTGVPQVKLAQ